MLLLLVLLWSQAFMRIWFLLPRDTIRIGLMYDALFSTLCLEFDSPCSHTLKCSQVIDLSAWLSVMPIEWDNFDLTAQEFCDALAVKNLKPLLSIPLHCDGCGAPFFFGHLICIKEGLIVKKHNKIRDAIGELAALLWGQVKREPVVAEEGADGETLITDLGVRSI